MRFIYIVFLVSCVVTISVFGFLGGKEHFFPSWFLAWRQERRKKTFSRKREKFRKEAEKIVDQIYDNSATGKGKHREVTNEHESF